MTTTDVEVVTGEILPTASSGLAFAYTPEQAGKWMRDLQEYRRAILIEEADYGVIPGTAKPSLYKPGAEKLLMAAGMGFRITKVDDEDSRTHQGVTYRCTVYRGSQENVIAECDGYAGYDESRFYTSLAESEAKERANATQYQRAVREWKIVEYKAPWNSVIKMAQKRALVGATLNALAASGLFTQDMEDIVEPRAVSFDALSLITPHLNALDGNAKAELKAWRQEEALPDPRQMDAVQAAAVLVKIGQLSMAQVAEATATATEPHPIAADGLPANPEFDVDPEGNEDDRDYDPELDIDGRPF